MTGTGSACRRQWARAAPATALALLLALATTNSNSTISTPTLEFGVPTLIGSSNLSRPGASHFWFPSISIATGIHGHVAQHVTLSGDGGSARGEQIMLTQDGGASYTVVKKIASGTSGCFNGYGDLGTWVPGRNASSSPAGTFRTIVGCNDCAGGSVGRPAFLQTWLDTGGSLKLVANESVRYTGTPPAFNGNRTCGKRPCGLYGPAQSIIRTTNGKLLASFYGYGEDGSMTCCAKCGLKLCVSVAHWDATPTFSI